MVLFAFIYEVNQEGNCLDSQYSFRIYLKALFCFWEEGSVRNECEKSVRGNRFSKMRNLGIYLTFSIIIGDGIDGLFILVCRCMNRCNLITLGSYLQGRASCEVTLIFILSEIAYSGSHLNSWILLKICHRLSVTTAAQFLDQTKSQTQYKHYYMYYYQRNPLLA